MKVLVETTPLYTARAGVARYVRGLLGGLRAVAPSGVEIGELGWTMENFGFGQPLRAAKTLAREWGWAKTLAPWRARDAGILHHTALPMIPFIRPVRHMVTLHDLALLRHPERFRRWQRSSGLRRLQRIAHADRVICVSRFVADEAMSLLGLPATRLDVIHEAAGPAAAVAPPSQALPGEYFLFVGSLEPGKNLALLRDIYRMSPVPLPPLVLAGVRWAGVAHEGAAPTDWHFHGHVDDGQLTTLYRGARALLFPSRYEGFGLPVLEAMTQGCPVLCGPVASLPEVGGEAAAYAELTVAAFGAAVRRLATDDAWGAELRHAGPAHAATFSWERCARETLAVYAAVSSR